MITDVARAVKEAKQSNVDFKMDKTAIVHVGLGKVIHHLYDDRDNQFHPLDIVNDFVGEFVRGLFT